jgi:hypothetical protein
LTRITVVGFPLLSTVAIVLVNPTEPEVATVVLKSPRGCAVGIFTTTTLVGLPLLSVVAIVLVNPTEPDVATRVLRAA